ncbi:hypothetical protein [Pararhizobium sp. LjRoot238]|uniref:hypothetical protein n=1 Tax=Pararhizobium sp. LjRoot238 TaxID=3342293 RepID=UPI003ECDC266
MTNKLNNHQHGKLTNIISQATDDGVRYCGDFEIMKRFRAACPELTGEDADRAVRGIIQVGRMLGGIPLSVEPELPPPDYSTLPPKIALHRRMVDIFADSKDEKEMQRRLVAECGHATPVQFKEAADEGLQILKERMDARKRRVEMNNRFKPLFDDVADPETSLIMHAERKAEQGDPLAMEFLRYVDANLSAT